MRVLIHPLAAAALVALAIAFGRWLRDPAPGAHVIALLVLTGLAAAAARRLYRPGGLARRPPPASPPPQRPRRPAPSPPPPPPPLLWLTDARVDINRAGVEELRTVPGVGPVTAARIVREREAGGPFASIEELTRVGGFGLARVRALSDRLRV